MHHPTSVLGQPSVTAPSQPHVNPSRIQPGNFASLNGPNVSTHASCRNSTSNIIFSLFQQASVSTLFKCFSMFLALNKHCCHTQLAGTAPFTFTCMCWIKDPNMPSVSSQLSATCFTVFTISQTGSSHSGELPSDSHETPAIFLYSHTPYI